MVFLIMHARGNLMTLWCDLRYSSINFIVPAILDLLIFCSMLGSLYSSLSFVYPANRHTLLLCTPIIFHSKVCLHLWLNRKVASFRFSWAMTETCFPLLSSSPAFSWCYRYHWLSCLWVLWAILDCLVLALWWAIWLFQNWNQAASTYPAATKP